MYDFYPRSWDGWTGAGLQVLVNRSIHALFLGVLAHDDLTNLLIRHILVVHDSLPQPLL